MRYSFDELITDPISEHSKLFTSNIEYVELKKAPEQFKYLVAQYNGLEDTFASGSKDPQEKYRQLQNLVHEHYHSLDGKVAVVYDQYDTGNGKSESIPALVVDARQAFPLDGRLSPEHPLFNLDNTLLNAISTVRTLDFVLNQLGEFETEAKYDLDKEREKLQKKFGDFIQKMEDLQKDIISGNKDAAKEIDNFHAQLNVELIKIIHRRKLDIGIFENPQDRNNSDLGDLDLKDLNHNGLNLNDPKTQKEYAKLLNYYRQMGNVLDDALAVQTISKDKDDLNKNSSIIHVQTAYPITKKTEKQKLMIDEEIIDPSKTSEYRNFHASKPHAYQMVNFLMKENIADEKHRLPSQMRDYILPSVKNGWIASKKIMDGDENGMIAETELEKAKTNAKETIYVRSGTPIYVSKGENKERIIEAAADDIAQLKLALKNFGCTDPIHYTILNTDDKFINLKNENTMVNYTIEAVDKLNGKEKASFEENNTMISENEKAAPEKNIISNFAFNQLGWFLPTKISEKLREIINSKEKNKKNKEEKSHLLRFTFLDREQRTMQAAEIALTASEANFINMFSCVSGRDRTGSMAVALELLWTRREYQERYKNAKIDITDEELDKRLMKLEAVGGHMATLPGIDIPGSPGMKIFSSPGHGLREIMNGFTSKLGFKIFKEQNDEIAQARKFLYLKSSDTNRKMPLPDEIVFSEDDQPYPELGEDYQMVSSSEPLKENKKESTFAIIAQLGSSAANVLPKPPNLKVVKNKVEEIGSDTLQKGKTYGESLSKKAKQFKENDFSTSINKIFRNK